MIFWPRSKTAKIREAIDPGRLQIGFWTNFHWFWEPFWHRFFDFFILFPKTRKPHILQTLQAKLVFWHVFLSQNLSFSGQFFIDFSCFFQDRSRRAFLEGPSADLCSKVRFWSDFRISGGPKMDPRASIFAQKASKVLVLFTMFCVLGPPRARPAIQTGPGTDFHRFWTDFGWILDRFLMDFRRIFYVLSACIFSLFPVSIDRLSLCFLSSALIFNGHFGNMLGYHFSLFPVSTSELALFPFCVAWRSARGAFQ